VKLQEMPSIVVGRRLESTWTNIDTLWRILSIQYPVSGHVGSEGWILLGRLVSWVDRDDYLLLEQLHSVLLMEVSLLPVSWMLETAYCVLVYSSMWGEKYRCWWLLTMY